MNPKDSHTREAVHRGIIAHFHDRLPVSEKTPIVSLGEGDTPLIFAPKLSDRLGLEVYLKIEGANPTGSFKDRGMTLALSKAKEQGAKAVICASTGNTSASAAAYAARAGLSCIVLLPEGKIAQGKLAQALMYGAKAISLQGNFDAALLIVRELAAHYPVELVNSINPFRLEGQKTAAFEVSEVLGQAPCALAIPVGNGGNITAYWQGFCEDYAAGNIESRPILLGLQAQGAAPLVWGSPVDAPETVATAIRIGHPARAAEATRSVQESGGKFDAVDDAHILETYRFLAREEGVFCEPASAASVAGALQQGPEYFSGMKRLVCVLTGHGLKDPLIALNQTQDVLLKAPADTKTVAGLLGL